MAGKILKFESTGHPYPAKMPSAFSIMSCTSNFSPTLDVFPTIIDYGLPCATVLSWFNCTAHDIITALKSCSSSNSNPDNISCRTLKHIARFIIYLLKIVRQHSFNDDIFPARWKQATVISL